MAPVLPGSIVFTKCCISFCSRCIDFIYEVDEFMKTAPQKQRQKTQLSHYHELSHIADLMEIPAGFLTTYMYFS